MLRKTFRAALSLLLVFSLLLGMSANGLMVLAQENEEETSVPQKDLHYVSLGDSMTNGYGLDGYNHNSGVADYGTGAYPNQFADWLDGENGDAKVTHAQLAMSGIRTEDIHWLLEFNYNSAEAIALVDKAVANLDTWEEVSAEWNAYFGCGDYWTVNEIVDHSRINATFAHIAGMTDYETYTGCKDHGKLVEFPETVEDKGTSYKSYSMAEKIAVIAKYYQENVAAADIISLSVGNGNLGVFGFGRILEVIGFQEGDTYLNYNYEDVLRECEPEMQEKLKALINEIKPMLADKLAGMADGEAMQNVMLYIAVSLAMNYAGTVDAILQMNSDVEIILIPVMNTFGDDFATVEGELTIGDLLGLVIDPMNKFIAGLPTYMQVTNHEVYKDAKFYWAESASVECMVATYEYPLTNPIIRDRFVESIVGGGSGMIWGLLNGDPDTAEDDMVVNITLAEIEAYEKLTDTEKLAYAATKSAEAMSISMYLAFEKAIVNGKDNAVTLDSVFGLGELFAEDAENPFGPIMDAFYAQAAIDGQAKLNAVVAFVAAASNGALDEQKVRILLGDEAAIKDYAWEEYGDSLIANHQQHETMEDVFACEVENCDYYCQDIRNLYAALKTDYAKYLFAAQVAATINEMMGDPAVIEILHKGYLADKEIDENAGEGAAPSTEKWTAAVYEAVAEMVYSMSGVKLTAAYVEKLYSAGEAGKAQAIYEVVAEMASTEETTVTADQVSQAVTVYGTYGESADEQVVALYNGYNTLNNNLTTIVNGVDLINANKDAITGGADSMFAIKGTVESLCTLLVMPETLGTCVAESNLAGLLALFARCVIGNGIGAHPSQAGHNTLADAVETAYGKNTAEDETDDNFGLDEVPAAKEIVDFLTRKGYLNDDQILDIGFYAYGLLKDGMTDGEEKLIADYIYNTLFLSGATNEQRIDIIGNVYAILDAHYGLSDNNANILAFEHIVDYLYNDAKLMNEDQAFAIVHFTYWKINDGLNGDDVMDIFIYTYKVLFAEGSTALNPAPGGAGVLSAPLTPEEQYLEDLKNAANMDALIYIYDELAAANPEIIEANPEIEVAKDLYDALTDESADGGAILSKEDVFDIFDTAIQALIVDPENTIPEGKTAVDVITEKVTEIAEDLPIEKQLAVLEKVSNAIDKLPEDSIPGGAGSILPGVGGGEDAGVSMSDITKYLNIARKVITNLREAEPSLWKEHADEKYAQISAVIFGMLMGEDGDIDPIDLIGDLMDMLFGDPTLSVEQKIQIVVVIYDTLAHEDALNIPKRDDIYDYATDLRDEVLNILDAEWTQTIKDLNADLKVLYGQLNTLTSTLNTKLNILAQAQRDELNKMIAERNALLIELEELEEKLDAARKGMITTYSTRSNTNPVVAELEAAVAETKAAIAALDASIAALSAKIDADLRGVAAIEAAIAQIKIEIGETETALDEVIDAIEQLNADLLVVYDASLVLNENLQNIYNLTFGQIDGKAVVEAVKAIVETVPAVIEKIQAVYDKTQEAVEYAKAAWELVEDFADIAQGHVDSIVDGVDNLVGLTEQQLADIKAAAEACKKAVDGVIAENQPEIEEALQNTYAQLKSVVLREVNNAKLWLTNNETTLIVGAAAVGAVLLPYLEGYVEIDFANGKITVNQEAILALIQPYTSKIDAEILKLQGEALKAEQWLKENYPIAKEELNKKLQALREELEDLEIKFENPYDEEYLAAKEAIEAQIEKLEALRDQLDAKYQEVLAYLNTVKAAIAKAELALDEVIAAGNVVDADLIALFNALTKLHGELVDLHDAVVDLHDAAVEELYEIFGYCGIVADNFVKVLNTLPAYVDVLVHAVELITSEETWLQIGEMLKGFAGDLADRLMEYLTKEETQQMIKDMIAEYGPVIAEKLLEILVYAFEEYGPEIADSIYNYLYNNPDEVIAFFNEYGDEMLALVEEYGDEALVVIAIFLALYGDEIADYVIENHEAILGAIFAWVDVHGENAAELIQVYAEALGLCDTVREQIAILENALAQLEAELENLKAQLENASEEAKKEILEKIAAIEAKIAQVKAAIAQLEAALEAAIAKGLADIEALKDAIKNLDEKVLALIAAAKQSAIEEINAAIAAIDAAIKNLDATLYELAGEAYENLKELLISGAEALLDAVIEAVKKYAPELADEIYNYLLNNPDEVIAFFNEYGDEIWALVEKYGDEALMAVGVVLYLYGDEIAAYIIENREELLHDMANWLSVHGENAAKLLQVYAEALGLCDLVRGEIAELEKLLGELEAELNEQLNTLNNVLMAQLAELEAELARLKAELENAVEAQKPAIEAAIAEIEKKIEQIKAAIEEVKALIADIQAKIEEIVALLPVMNEKLQALVDSLFNLDEALKYLLEAGIEAGAPLVQKALDAVANAVKDLVGVVSDAAAEELGKLIDAAKEILDKAYYEATHGDYHITPGESYYVGLGDDLSVSQSFVDLLAATLGIDYANLAASGMSMTDLLYILDENFVADEYTLATFGGDVEALREVYIAELMKADLVTVGVGSFGITDFISAQAQGSLAMLLNEQLGDWLNNKYFGETLTGFVSQYVDLNATTYTMDWISYIGEEGVEELNKVLADVRADLIEKGIPEYYTIDIGMALELPLDPGSITVTIPVVDLLTMMTESYMYAYVTHLFNAGEVFNLIHQIAPNAELVVVGMFNPMDELVLNIAGTTIALGDYYEYMVEVMNLRYLGYAFVAPNTTFVAVPDAQSEIDLYVENFENIDELLMMLALGEVKSSADASEVGQEYIKDQIMNALNVTKSILGDVNLDGKVNSDDAQLILMYEVGMIKEEDLELVLADVNGDGLYNSDDAQLILMLEVGLIESFPAEN